MTHAMATVERHSIDPQLLRTALGRFATGVTVVTTRGPCGKREGLTCNSFTSVSLDPPLILWSLRRDSASLATFSEAGCFSVNVLGVEQASLCRHFATRQPDKFADISHELGSVGCPVLDAALAVFDCETERVIDGGDHVIFLGRVRRAEIREGAPLVFFNGHLGDFAALN